MKILISITNLNMRSAPSLKAQVIGTATKGIHEYSNSQKADNYKWYEIAQDTWVAGVSGVEEISDWVEPRTVPKDPKKNQIYVGVTSLTIRKSYSTSAAAMSYCKAYSYYNVLDTKKGDYYTWYKIGDEAWCAGVEGVVYYGANTWIKPVPVDVDSTKDQVYIGNVTLSIRKDHSTKSDKMGVCDKKVNYNVLDVSKQSDYTWYKIGDDSWIADCDDEVVFYPKGGSRVGPELKAELNKLTDKIKDVIDCIDKNQQTELYEATLANVKALNKELDQYDSFKYDLVDPKEYDEIDLLYTTDVHGAWVGYSMDGNYLNPVFSYKDVGTYRNKLANSNIKALLVDAGDWSRPCKAYTDYQNTGIMYPANDMKSQDYFMTTYGNHEWRWSQYGEADTESILNKLGCMTACNLFKNGKLVYKPYRTAKIGSKRIAVIGIGYPSANGSGNYSNGEWHFENYTFYDDTKLFLQVQKYINELKAAKFDYIVAVCHMCKSTYESDARYNARTDSLIKNTIGLNAVIQGHYNYATNAETITDASGKKVLLAHEAGANLNSFGRLQFKSNGTVTSYLLDDRGDLNRI